MKAVALAILLMAASAQAQVQQFSLEEAKQYAVEHNIDAKNAQLNVDAAQSTVNQVTRIGLPQVSGEVRYVNFLQTPTSLIPAEFFGGTPGEYVGVQFGTKHNLNATISASQLLFDGSFFIGVKAASMFVELQSKEQVRKEIDVRLGVSKAYFAVLVSSRNLQLLNESHDLLEDLHHETSELNKAGFVEAIEVDRLTLSLSTLKTQISSVERYKTLSESLLKFQMGLDLATPIELTDSLGSLTSPGADLMMMDGDAAQRIEMDIINAQLALAEANIKRYKAGYAPSLAAFATFDYSAQRSTFNFFDFDQPWYPSTLVGLSLRVPIWDSFTKSAQIQKEKTNVQMIMNYRDQVTQGLNLELQQARTNYKNASEQERTLKSNLELAQKILDIATIKYQEGVGSSLEVSTSQSTVLQTQSAYINALYELLIAKTDLEKALGIL